MGMEKSSRLESIFVISSSQLSSFIIVREYCNHLVKEYLIIVPVDNFSYKLFRLESNFPHTFDKPKLHTEFLSDVTSHCARDYYLRVFLSIFQKTSERERERDQTREQNLIADEHSIRWPIDTGNSGKATVC